MNKEAKKSFVHLMHFLWSNNLATLVKLRLFIPNLTVLLVKSSKVTQPIKVSKNESVTLVTCALFQVF